MMLARRTRVESDGNQMGIVPRNRGGVSTCSICKMRAGNGRRLFGFNSFRGVQTHCMLGPAVGKG